MKIPFFGAKQKEIPPFYEAYAQSFNTAQPSLESMPFIAFDTETTGLDVKNDRILCIGAVAIMGNTIYTDEALEVYVEQDVYSSKSAEIHGILKKGKQKRITEEQAVKKFLDFIGNSVLVGHHVGYDVAMINNALKRLGAPRLKNKLLDTGLLYKNSIHEVNLLNKDKVYSLDELCDEMKISMEDRHTAAGDAYITALAFLKICSRMRRNGKLTLKNLFKH
ncbi:MAG: DNA polymerase III subunit epsilon [Cytophagaceae bacterium]|nr:DNA polymerase III subunit epsilon [Cytophagaceae bacterium]|tara:strand:- start:24850 stop:25512 length:663 start_codon:yes stop_codon:yes gene_type:complete